MKKGTPLLRRARGRAGQPLPGPLSNKPASVLISKGRRASCNLVAPQGPAAPRLAGRWSGKLPGRWGPSQSITMTTAENTGPQRFSESQAHSPGGARPRSGGMAPGWPLAPPSSPRPAPWCRLATPGHREGWCRPWMCEAVLCMDALVPAWGCGDAGREVGVQGTPLGPGAGAGNYLCSRIRPGPQGPQPMGKAGSRGQRLVRTPQGREQKQGGKPAPHPRLREPPTEGALESSSARRGCALSPGTSEPMSPVATGAGQGGGGLGQARGTLTLSPPPSPAPAQQPQVGV